MNKLYYYIKFLLEQYLEDYCKKEIKKFWIFYFDDKDHFDLEKREKNILIENIYDKDKFLLGNMKIFINFITLVKILHKIKSHFENRT